MEYYSGCDIQVFFRDIWVDDIVTVTFTPSQQKAPIYGFASQQFDAVAPGTFIVRGSFTIAFKSKDYLGSILKAIEERPSTRQTPTLPRNQQNAGLATSAEAFGRFKPGTRGFRLEDWAQGLPSSPQFAQITEALETTFWGASDKRTRTRSPRIDEHDKLVPGPLPGRIGQGFDILISYGTEASRRHTVNSLHQVHIDGGPSTTFTPDGNPIAEVYSFFARGMNE